MDKLKDLKDIKDIVDIEKFGLFENIPFNFLFTYMLIAILVIILLFLIFDFIISKKYKRFFKTAKEIAFENLHSINYQDTKDIVYKFSQNYIYFINEKNSKELQMLESKLYIYKYKKDVEELEEELKDRIKKFVKGIKC